MDTEARAEPGSRTMAAPEAAPFVNMRDPSKRLGPDGKPAVSRRAPKWQDVPDEKWNDWRWQLSNRVNDLEEIAEILELTEEEREASPLTTSSASTSRPTSSASSTPRIPTTRSAAR